MLPWTTAILVLPLILLTCFWRKQEVREPVRWLTARESAELLRVGPFTRWKFKLLRFLPGSFWRWYMSGRESILIQAQQGNFEADIALGRELSSDPYTNADGVRAWLISPDAVATLKSKLKALPVRHFFNLTTSDGGQAQMSDAVPPPGITNIPPDGVILDLLPKVARHSISLVFTATLTANSLQADGTFVGLTTNLVLTGQVLIPNGGGLVILGSGPHATNCCLVFSATAVDANGKPKSL